MRNISIWREVSNAKYKKYQLNSEIHFILHEGYKELGKIQIRQANNYGVKIVKTLKYQTMNLRRIRK